jgi:hypothetical protein
MERAEEGREQREGAFAREHRDKGCSQWSTVEKQTEGNRKRRTQR